MTKISVSVDDGNPLDLKVAEILAKRKIPAIFYIPIKSHAKLLNSKEIKSIAKSFEIGSHGYDLSDPTTIATRELTLKLTEAKQRLEDLTGKPVVSYAPSLGRYNPKTLEAAKLAGFNDVRSGRILSFARAERSSFLWHPNLHFYPHSFTSTLLHLLKNHDFEGLIKRLTFFPNEHLELVREFKKAGSFHLWAHSWELEKYHLWEDFEKAID